MGTPGEHWGWLCAARPCPQSWCPQRGPCPVADAVGTPGSLGRLPLGVPNPVSSPPPRNPPRSPQISSPSPSCRSPSWRADPAWGQPWGPGLSPPKKTPPHTPLLPRVPVPALVPPAPGCSVPRSAASAHPRGGPRCPRPHLRTLTRRDTERGPAPRPSPPTFWGCCPLRWRGTQVTPSPVNRFGGCHCDEGSRWVPAGGGDVRVR